MLFRPTSRSVTGDVGNITFSSLEFNYSAVSRRSLGEEWAIFLCFHSNSTPSHSISLQLNSKFTPFYSKFTPFYSTFTPFYSTVAQSSPSLVRTPPVGLTLWRGACFSSTIVLCCFCAKTDVICKVRFDNGEIVKVEPASFSQAGGGGRLRRKQVPTPGNMYT